MRFKKWRIWAGVVLFIGAELMLFGASEGPQKWQWIISGTVPDFLLAVGFIIRLNATKWPAVANDHGSDLADQPSYMPAGPD